MNKYVIKGSSVWIDDLGWEKCEPLQIFKSQYQATSWVLDQYGTYRIVK